MDLNIPDRFFVSDAICDEKTGLDPFGKPTQGFLEVEHHLMFLGDKIVYDYFHNWCMPSGTTCLNSLDESLTTRFVLKEDVRKSIERSRKIFRAILSSTKFDSDFAFAGMRTRPVMTFKPISLFDLSPEDSALAIRRHRDRKLVSRIKNKFKNLFRRRGLF